jgi:hypothetical protein
MRKIRILPILLLICFLPLLHVSADDSPRSIYVGDIIELKISPRTLTEDEIREKFRDFEIVGLTEARSSYTIKLRTFDIGEKRVVLGDKEIVIVVRSTLDEIQSDGPMEGGSGPAVRAPAFPWFYIFIGLLAVFIITSVFTVIKLMRKGKNIPLTPYQSFLKRSSGVPYEDKEFFVKLTAYFKEYIEAVYQCEIKGMTTSELLYTADKLPRMSGVKEDLRHWLRECDYFKFTGNEASMEKKQEIQRRLVKLAEQIEAANRTVQRPAYRAVPKAGKGARL